MIRNGPKRIISSSSGLELLQMVSKPDIGRCANENAGLRRGWIVRSHINLKGKQSISYNNVETSSQHTCFKTVKLTTIRNE